MNNYKPRKISILQNIWGNWYGYISGRKAAAFCNCPTSTAEQQAEAWKIEMERIEVERTTK